MSSDAKQTGIKSKSRINKILSKGSSGAASTNNVSEKSSSSISSAMSLLDKLDMNNLKQTTYRYVKSSPQATQDNSGSSARRACIDYALELVISNLIVNGQLDPGKAYQMRTPIMKSQIASMCDKILDKRSKKTSSKKLLDAKKLSKAPVAAISRAENAPGQRWAVQPAALPITIITDKVSSKVSKGIVGEKKQGIFFSKSGEVTSSAEEIRAKVKVKRSKARSVGSMESKTQLVGTKRQPLPALTLTPKEPAIKRNVNVEQTQAQLQQQHHYAPSSEVPSNFSIEGNFRTLSGNSGNDRGILKVPRVQFEDHEHRADIQLPTILSSDTMNTESSPAVDAEKKGSVNANNTNDDIPVPETPIWAENPNNRAESAVTASCPGTAKTLTSIISSATSISLAGKGYRVHVDMKGFLNDEIAMEVEGRQLIFLASRPRKQGMNLRKVTEIIDVPEGVKMENLKIGRRKDGFVVIEEHEAEDS